MSTRRCWPLWIQAPFCKKTAREAATEQSEPFCSAWEKGRDPALQPSSLQSHPCLRTQLSRLSLLVNTVTQAPALPFLLFYCFAFPYCISCTIGTNSHCTVPTRPLFRTWFWSAEVGGWLPSSEGCPVKCWHRGEELKLHVSSSSHKPGKSEERVPLKYSNSKNSNNNKIN